jgi:tetratricopeptide (TPR) repeat protein
VVVSFARSRHFHARRARSSAVALAWLTGAMVFAQATPSHAQSGTPAPTSAPRRAVLPKLPSIALPPPAPGTVPELEAALGKLATGSVAEREKARVQLQEDGAELLPAMAKRLAELRKTANRDEIGKLIEEARKRGKKSRSASKKKKGSASDDGAKDDGDWLAFVLAGPHNADSVFKDTVSILAIERALTDLGTTPAVRELINVYFYFGDLFRIDVQHMVERLGDRAVPALIEGRKHDVEKVRRWCAKELDVIGKAIPGEAVQVGDSQTLADVLRAYGRTKEIDALRVVVSFTGNDRIQVRDAAREAVVSYGEAAVWMLREQYETFTGNRPPPGASWDRIAQDIFAAHDSARMAEVASTFDEGKELEKAGKLEEMASAFDKVLAHVPSFDRRDEMAPGYLQLAQKLDRTDPQRALLLARKALRLAPEAPQHDAWASYIATLEGEELVTHGLSDTTPFKRALEKDPQNERAKAALQRLETQTAVRPPSRFRYLAAGAIGLTATLASLLIGFWGRKKPAAPVPMPDEMRARHAPDEPRAEEDKKPDEVVPPAPGGGPDGQEAGEATVVASGEDELHHDDREPDAEDEKADGDGDDQPDV